MNMLLYVRMRLSLFPKKYNSFLRELCFLKNTFGEQSEPSRRRQTKLTAFRFPGCEGPGKLHIRSFRFPLQSKAHRFALRRRSSEMSELSCRYTEARDMELATTRRPAALPA